MWKWKRLKNNRFHISGFMTPPRFFEAFKKKRRKGEGNVAYTKNDFKKRRVTFGIVIKAFGLNLVNLFIGSSLLISPEKAFKLVPTVNMF